MPRRDHTQTELAYSSIREKIIGFQLLPSAIVSDYQLAAELGMSRAPVREAILLLGTDGLVETGADGKTRVSSIGYNDIMDIMHVRSALEGESIRAIARGGWLDTAQLQALSHNINTFGEPANTEAILENNRLDDDFHTTIVLYSGNRRSLQIIRRLNIQMLRARWVNVALPARQSEIPAEHAAILDALADRDLPGALAANERHLQNSTGAYHTVFSDPNMRQVMSGIYSFFSDENKA